MKCHLNWVLGLLALVLLAGCANPFFTAAPAAHPALPSDAGYKVQLAPAGLVVPQAPLPKPDAQVFLLPQPPLAAPGRFRPAVAPPTPTPQPILAPVAAAAGPLTSTVGVPAPAPAVAAVPEVQTPAGPSFAWSETENFLILGTDRHGSGNWRTDSIMVLGLDRQNRRAAVLSIPRDLYVDIPGYGWTRINVADYMGEQQGSGGGPALVSQILNNLFGITTQHWLRVEMSGFQSLVDAVGGVTIHLDCAFYEPIFNLTTNSWDYFVLPSGENKMDGETAYWFARLRLRESDIGRAQRQRQILWALRDQALNANLLPRLPELWNAFQQTITTDLSLLEMVELGQFGLTLDPANVRAAGISLGDLQSWTTPEGASVLRIADPSRVRAVVDGIWDAPAMADAYRQDAARCPFLPPEVQAKLEQEAGAQPEAVPADASGAQAPAGSGS